MWAPDHEPPIREDEVCRHYLRGECAHNNESTCWHCAEFDLDEVCWHYVSGECANNDACVHLHPAELNPVVISLLARTPSDSRPSAEGQGAFMYSTLDYCNNVVTYCFQRSLFTLPHPYAFDHRAPRAPTSVDAKGQPTNTQPHNYQNCWPQHRVKPTFEAPHPSEPANKKRRLEVDDQSPSAREPHPASVDEDVGMVDQFAKTTLDSEPTER